MTFTKEERTLRQKQANYRWRDNNKEKYNTYVAGKMREYMTANREHYNKTKRDLYHWTKIRKVFLQILLP